MTLKFFKNSLLGVTLFFLPFFSCQTKTAEIKGNATYNFKQISILPARNAKFFLLPVDTTKKGFEAVADEKGDFSIAEIPPGDYFLIGVSSNGSLSPVETFIQLYPFIYSPIIGVDNKNSILVEKAFTAANNVITNSNLDSSQQELQIAAELRDSVYHIIPENSQLLSHLSSYLNLPQLLGQNHYLTSYPISIRIKKVTVKQGESMNEKIDFGIKRI